MTTNGNHILKPDPQGEYLRVDDVEAALRWCLVDLYTYSTHDKIRDLLKQIEDRGTNG